MLNQKQLSSAIAEIRRNYELILEEQEQDLETHILNGWRFIEADKEYGAAYDDGYIDGQIALLKSMSIYSADFEFETEESGQEFEDFQKFARCITKKRYPGMLNRNPNND